jgi:hypothetical protein
MNESYGTVAEEAVPTPPVHFDPRRWRQFVFGPAILFVLAYVAFAVTRIVHAIKYPDLVWPGELLYASGLLLVVIAAVLLSLFVGRHSPYAIALDAKDMTGRSCAWRGGSSSIPLNDVDRVRSARRSLAGRLLGWQCLYSTQGARIVFYRRYFDRELVNDLLDRLGIRQ